MTSLSREAAKTALTKAENAWRKSLNAHLSARDSAGEAEAHRAYQAAYEALREARLQYEIELASTPKAKRRKHASMGEADEAGEV